MATATHQRSETEMNRIYGTVLTSALGAPTIDLIPIVDGVTFGLFEKAIEMECLKAIQATAIDPYFFKNKQIPIHVARGVTPIGRAFIAIKVAEHNSQTQRLSTKVEVIFQHYKGPDGKEGYLAVAETINLEGIREPSVLCQKRVPICKEHLEVLSQLLNGETALSPVSGNPIKAV